jgi:DNA invertase Pin-like site-specific DNA recombinase
MGRTIGYARVSTQDQSLDMQVTALKAAGCDIVFEDNGLGGGSTDRPGLKLALAAAQAGDTLLVWKIDRLARSLRDLTEIIATLADGQVGFRSLTEALDISSACGRFTLQILSAVAELEREIIRERTRAGMKAAKERGAKIGRRPVLTPDELAIATARATAGEPITAIAKSLGVGRSTLYRLVG